VPCDVPALLCRSLQVQRQQPREDRLVAEVVRPACGARSDLLKMKAKTRMEHERPMRFEWDEDKNEGNIRRHGIDFADLPALFDSPLLTDLDERMEYGEERWVTIGMLSNLAVVVVWTERAQETIRIISARKANTYERKRYEAYLANRLGPA
jgi:uncharacterized DUF497 family protein